MWVSFEWQLFLGAWFFYLLDSALLLCGNELVLAVTGGRWHFGCGSDVQLLRKYPHLPNPFLPGTAIFRVSWAVGGARELSELPVLPQCFFRALRPLQYQTSILAVLLLGGLAWVAAGHPNALLPLIFTVYASVLLQVLLLCHARTDLGLTGKVLGKLVFDSLACPPLALNLVRKISMGHRLTRDPVLFARVHFDAKVFHELIGAICHRLDEMLLVMPEGNPQYGEIQSYRKKLMDMQP